MHVTRISHFVDLASYIDDWNRLASDNPFISWTWLSTWWKHFGDDNELYVLVIEDDHGNVVGFAPWYLESSAARGRRVKFLGSGNVCSDYMRILTQGKDIERVARAVALWLQDLNRNHHDHDESDSWDFLSFEGVEKGEPSMVRLRHELAALGHQSNDEATASCWRIQLGTDWEAYVGRLSKKYRRKVRDVRKKYIDVGRTEFAYARDKQQFGDFYETFVELHQQRRESLSQPGCFAAPDFTSFLRDVAGSLFQRGELRLSRLLIDGKPAASSLGLVSNGVHYMYQTGMSPGAAEHQPGWVMNVHNILAGHEHGIVSIDLLRGDEPYKASLGAESVELVKFRVVANQVGARVRNKFWQMRTSIKQNGLTALRFPSSESTDSKTPGE